MEDTRLISSSAWFKSVNEFLTNDTIKKRGLSSKVIDERCHILVHGCVLKGQVSSNDEPAPQGDPEVVHVPKYCMYVFQCAEENQHHL